MTENAIRRTKIVATLGPATDAPGMLERLVAAGVDVVRLNLSHGQPQDHRTRAEAVREAARAVGREVGVLADLQGPKIRIEKFAGGPVELVLMEQRSVDQVLPTVSQQLPGRCFIERITSLVAHGEVMTDNLVYVAHDGLAPALREGLESGRAPIGRLLGQRFVRREFLAAGTQALHQRLWRAVGLPDATATRTYRIDTPEGPCMLITETYRRGMRMQAP